LKQKRKVNEVLILCRNICGKSGSTLISEGVFATALKGDDSPQKHYEDTIKAGFELNIKKLARILTREAPKRILELEEFGVSLEKVNNELFIFQSPGHSKPRSVKVKFRTSILKGPYIIHPLRLYCKRLGVKIYDLHEVIKLISINDEVYGCIAINKLNNEIIVFISKATILATGGLGYIYKLTDNTSDITGSGYALAYEVGAKLIDMEFVQFYPLYMLKPISGILIPTSVLCYGAKLINRLGERFMHKYDAIRRECTTRDILSRVIFNEVIEGRGVNEGIYVDLSNMDSMYMNIVNYLLSLPRLKNVDLRKCRILVSPVAHFMVGGVLIDEQCETSVRNLYACGEVVGGVHGASRLAGNALSKAVVFGARAGYYAALKAKEARTPKITMTEINEALEEFKLDDHDYRVEALNAILKELREYMWSNVGIVRSEESLRNMLSYINGVWDELELIKVSNLKNLIKLIKLKHMVKVAEIITKSALLRGESRGVHYRIDYPNIDNSWLKHIIVDKNEISIKSID